MALRFLRCCWPKAKDPKANTDTPIRPCPICRNFRPAHRRQFGGVELFSRRYDQRRLSQLLDSHNSGCAGCDLLVNAIEVWKPGWVAEYAQTATLAIGLECSILSVDLYTPLDREKHGRIKIFQSQGDVTRPMTRLPFCSTPGIVPDSSSGAAFDRANTWLNHCLKNHASCATDTDGTSEHTPRRLLKVPQMEQPEQERVLLVEDPPKGVPYAALSYCWGSEPTGVIRTLRANKATHATAGIPLRSLPKTIQDAVLVCARLGLAYVWIDALCIVQDDAADWDREARLMKTVYRGSRLTVAAHAAKSCRDGFLGPQAFGGPQFQRPFRTAFSSVSGPGPGPSTREGQGDQGSARAYVRLGKPAVRPPAPSVLDTRGWTLQEALLPRRTLHFTGREMAWECDEAHLCECGHVEGLMFGEAYPMVRTEWRRNASAPRGGASGDGGWVTLVKRYSRRQLTRGSDKLIAIAGIAELVENMKRAADSEEAYWAGIFRSGLPAQLLWAVQDEDELRSRGIGVPSIRPQPYRAPTWSWASVDGPVHYSGVGVPTVAGSSDDPSSDGGEFVSLVRILGSSEFSLTIPSASGNADTKNSMPAVSARDLKLEGLVIPVALVTVKLALTGFGRAVFELSERNRGTASTVRPQDGTIWEVACDVQREPCLACRCLARDIPYATTGDTPWGHGGAAFPTRGDRGGERDWEEVVTDNTDLGPPSVLDMEGFDINPDLDGMEGAEVVDLNEGLGYNIEPTLTDGSEDFGSHGRAFSVPDIGSENMIPIGTVPAPPAPQAELPTRVSGWCKQCLVEGGYWDQPQFCCLRIASQRVNAGLLGELTYIFFLVLSPSTLVPGGWERVGIGNIRLEAGQDVNGSLFSEGETRALRLV